MNAPDQPLKIYFFLEVLRHPMYLINHLVYSKEDSKDKEA